MAGFLDIPRQGGYVLANAHLPRALAVLGAAFAGTEALVACDITVEAGRIGRIAPAGTLADEPALPTVDLAHGLVLPRFVDVHTHLDKGHIWRRSPNPDGTFMGALASVAADRAAHWSAEDVRRRMEFGLRCAYAHGTRAIRTHLDSIGPQTAITWRVFAELRAEWAEKIALEAVSLLPVDTAVDDRAAFDEVVATVADHGGVLGAVTFLGAAPSDKLDAALDRFFMAAAAHGLDLDFHADESASPQARSLERIALAALRHRSRGRVVAGHCCSLALMADEERGRVIDRVGEAGIGVVSLPMCNLYLQDRQAGRTPRWRGVAPVHELDAAGIAVMLASDNTRDPFYAYGDLDMLEVLREATRILHLDHSARPWERLLAPAPAAIMRSAGDGLISQGAPADLVLVRARDLGELLSRPQSDRVVLVAGRAIDTTTPDYRELDGLTS